MIKLFNKRLKGLTAHSVLGGVMVLVFSTPAVAKTSANISVSAGGRISSNPFLETAGASSGQAVSLEVAPFVKFEGASSVLTLQGAVRLDQYLKNYGSDESANVGANYTNRLSGKTSVRAGAGFRSSRATLRDILQSRTDLSLDPALTPGFLTDPTLIGRNRRSNTWNVSAGVTTQLTNRDIVSLDFGMNRLHSPSQINDDYRQLFLQTSLSHKLSSRTSLQFSVSGSSSKYLRHAAGNGTNITPMVGITTRLNSSFSLTALVGSTFSRIDRGDGTKISSNTWATQLSLCKRSEREKFCLDGARNTQPTSTGEVRAITSASLSYDRQLDEKNSLFASVAYTQGGRNILPGATLGSGSGATKYITASSTLSHRFNRRFVGFVTPSYERANDTTLAPRQNYSINFGLRYIIGELR